MLLATKPYPGPEEVPDAHTLYPRSLKIAALVRIGVRRIKVAMTSGCPYRREFQAAHARLSAAAA